MPRDQIAGMPSEPDLDAAWRELVPDEPHHDDPSWEYYKRKDEVVGVVAAYIDALRAHCADLTRQLAAAREEALDAIRALRSATSGRIPMTDIVERRVTIYRDDSTVQVVYERVKATFWTAGNTVFVISQYTGDDRAHRYIHWPRERFCWFKDEPSHLPLRGTPRG